MPGGIFAFLIAVAYWPGLMAAALVPRWCIIAVGLPLIASLDPRTLRVEVSLLLVGAIAWGALSLAWSADPLGGAFALFHAALLCGVMMLAAEHEDIAPLMKGMALGIGVSAVLCIYQTYYPSPVRQLVAPAGLFDNSLALAEFAAPVLVWTALRSEWLLSVLVLVPIGMCHSRTAILAAMAGLGYGWVAQRRWNALCVLAACGTAGVAFLTLYGFGKEGTAFERVGVWLDTFRSFTPIGHGLGWFAVAFPYAEYAHSDALQALAELGPGALFFLALPFAILGGTKSDFAAKGAFIAACIEGTIAFSLHLPASGFAAAVVAGTLASDRNWLRSRRRESATLIRARDLRGAEDGGTIAAPS